MDGAFLEQRSIYDPPPQWLKTWSGDGIISRLAWPEVAETARKRRIPAVDLNEQVGDFGLPLLANDQAAIGRLAAEHLLERGFVQFGYVGYRGLLWSDGRRDSFTQTVAEARLSLRTIKAAARAWTLSAADNGKPASTTSNVGWPHCRSPSA